MRVGRLLLVSLVVILGIGIVVHGFWRTVILATGALFLCWGALGTRLRRPSLLGGALIAGFGVGLYDGHPFLTALLGALLAVLLWRPLRVRRGLN
jgi:hypothetical protein